MFWLFNDPVVIMKEIMAWLFKDVINSGLAQFDHAQSNSKKCLKAKKNQISQNKLFSRKTSNKIFMCLLAPFLFAKFQKILTVDPKLWRCAIFWTKIVHLLQTIFFLEAYHSHSHLPISPFHCAKRLPADPELWGCAIFAPKMAHFSKWEFFSEKLLMDHVSFTRTYLHAKNQSQIFIY